MMEAARALTVLGRARLAGDAEADTSPGSALQVMALYQTAERLGQHVRQMSSEARSLLITAKQMLDADPQVQCQVPPDFDEVCKMMDEAMDRAVEAIERLDAMRLAAAPASGGRNEPLDAPPEVLIAADDLFQRLRQAGSRS
ncbi:hypothetical protein [Ideonella sp. BN130291]|uniref:hypothetical protein n=1 Tax=Ideonella sp. BN130291 TaxID=3112940 RepID=UPI002E26D30A|nr:hypothetical protein [Ideonella sp. BN130291]